VNLPDQLIRQLRPVAGFDLEHFVAAHEQAAPTSIRLHPLKGNSVSVNRDTPVPWSPGAYYLPARPLFTTDPLLHAGAYYVQEASSMFLSAVLETIMPQPGNLRVLDLCAAPGGKSTLIASRLTESDLLISNDVIRTRAAILEENMTRWGYANTWVSSNDPRDFGRISNYFDIIVVDAPCSGSGLFRKDARAVDEWSEDNVKLCAERQQRILADILPALKKDGYLVYATCSYSAEENEANLDFLADHGPFESVPVPTNQTWGITRVHSPKHGIEGYRFFPDKVKGEGFFISVLQKTEGAREIQYQRFKTAQNKLVKANAAYLLQDATFNFIENERGLYTAIHAIHEADYHFLKEYIYLRRAGTLLGSPAQKDWIPEHDIALSVHASSELPFIELDLENALLFLKKENFTLPDGTGKGWYIVRYKGQGLGWIKALGNRVNNYLPKSWRIRMEIDFDAL
jgi:16S rRNA C967 or C1407 C5-methylase (RsmB/RsmF family)/NOL1/NOP2/fmu family ribosome biogenesis protein